MALKIMTDYLGALPNSLFIIILCILIDRLKKTMKVKIVVK